MRFINGEEQLRALKEVECFVLDMDGTFNLGMDIIPGAMDFYNKAVSLGKRVMFLTNNSSRNRKRYVEKLNNMGCPAGEKDVYTSGMATYQYVLREFPGRKVYLLGTDELKEEFTENGVNLVEDGPEVVVAGFDTSLDYEKLTKVCDFVRDGLPYIATHPDVNCPSETGLLPDLGAFMALIEVSAGRKADIIIGKPYDEIIEGLMEMVKLPRNKIAICGDRLATDIATGVNSGVLSICVLTGATTEDDIEASEIKPSLVFDRLGDVADYL